MSNSNDYFKTGAVPLDPNYKQTLEIWVDGAWVKTDEDTFRSFTGARMVNGGRYHGPVFKHGTDDVAVPFQYDLFGVK
jgi:hypothetical protein